MKTFVRSFLTVLTLLMIAPPPIYAGEIAQVDSLPVVQRPSTALQGERVSLANEQQESTTLAVAWSEVTPPVAGGNYLSAVFGDITNDGKLDVVAGSSGGGVQVWAGDGGGNWASLVEPTSGVYTGIALGDVDNDGNLDVVASADGSGVHIWTGDGTGSGWTVMTSPLTTGRVAGVALGDINHDGKLDIAAGSNAGFGLGVVTGDGAGGWTPAGTGLPAAGTYSFLAFGDLNNDGSQDLVATSRGGGVQAWIGNGAGVWTLAASGLPAIGDFYGLAVADINADGILDIAAGGDDRGIRVWAGSLFLTWTLAATGLPDTGDYWGVALGDLNNDGRLDLAASHPTGGMQVWIGDGGGSWAPASAGLPISGFYTGIALGDLDDDGLLDLLAANSSALGVRAWVNTGTPDLLGGWNQISSPTTTGGYQGAAAADFDHDGDLDIVGASNSSGIHLWVGDGGNTWEDAAAWTNPDLPTADNYWNVACGDLDHNGTQDVVATNGGGRGIAAWRYVNVGWHEYADGLPAVGRYLGLDLGDFNRDGNLDLVAGSQLFGINVYASDGAGRWTLARAGLPNTGAFYGVAFGDLNRDGDLDIVAGSESSGIGVWQGHGDGTWTATAAVTGAGQWIDVALGDVNDDGDLDLAATSDGQGVWAWAGNGSFGWTVLTQPAVNGKYRGVALGDFNQDGRLDVAAGSGEDHGLKVWTGNGGATWTDFSTNLPTTGNYPAVVAARIDHDGVLDLIGARYGDGSVHAWTGAEGAAPSGWADFGPTNWISTTAPVDSSIGVQDTGSGLNVNSAEYSYLGVLGSWSPWQHADCTGVNGTTALQTITAKHVTFGQDSGGSGTANQIRFRVRDMVGNMGYSEEYAVRIDATPPSNPTSFPDSSHWPGGGWEDDNTVWVDWDGADDVTSGVAGYSFVFAATYQLPDAVQDVVLSEATSNPLADGEWMIYVRTQDRAGNWAPDAVFAGPFRVDTGPPNSPTDFTATPAVATWSNDNTVYISWSGASDGGGGVWGYRYSWTTAPLGSPDEIVPPAEGTNTTSAALADGNSWYFHIKTVDRASNWSDAVHWGPFYIDTTAPTSAASAPAAVDSSSFTVNWLGDDSGGSAGLHYDVQYRDARDTAWTDWQLNTSATSATFIGSDGHTYQFRARARDRVGNQEAWPATPDATTVIASLDFEGFALEVTQGIQDLNNSVTLVANKHTYARCHMRSLAAGDQGPVTARLTATRGGVGLGTIPPNNASSAISARTTPHRGHLDDSFYFDLPATWLHGAVQLTCEVNPTHELAESDYGNNIFSVDVTFEDSPPMELLIVDACYATGGTTYHASDDDRQALASWLRRAYPINELDVRWGVRVPCYTYRPEAWEVNIALGFNKIFAVLFGGEDLFTRYYGMVDDRGGFTRGQAAGTPSTVASGPSGCAGPRPCRFGWDTDGTYADWYGGHELGHTYGRDHTRGTQPPACAAECCGSEAGNQVLYPDGDISPTRDTDDPDALFGFDISTLDLYPPTWKDLMTYCDNEWMSDITYEGILNLMRAEPRLAVASSQPLALQEYLAVFGTVYTGTNQVALKPFYRVANAKDVLPRTPGEYSIRLLDGGNQTLADYAFTPRFSPVDPGQACQAEPTVAQAPSLILEFVPWVNGTARIAIVHQGQELAARLVSAHAPQVTLTGPNGGESLGGGQVTVSWQASDIDGDALTYALEYSVDSGAHWQPLGNGIATTSLVLDTASLAGTDQGRFRVWASDGVNTAYDASDGNFSVPNKAPMVEITFPASDSFYWTGQSVALIATAVDVEDGTLGDAAYVWQSDLGGALGTGTMIHVTNLPPGTNNITVTATDHGGKSSTDTVVVYVDQNITRIYLPVVTKE